jgi:hypothetical protein
MASEFAFNEAKIASDKATEDLERARKQIRTLESLCESSITRIKRVHEEEVKYYKEDNDGRDPPDGYIDSIPRMLKLRAQLQATDIRNLSTWTEVEITLSEAARTALAATDKARAEFYNELAEKATKDHERAREHTSRMLKQKYEEARDVSEKATKDLEQARQQIRRWKSMVDSVNTRIELARDEIVLHYKQDNRGSDPPAGYIDSTARMITLREQLQTFTEHQSTWTAAERTRSKAACSALAITENAKNDYTRSFG